MENTIKGWQYISAIFQRMLDSFERDCLIEPLFIFRGITRRYFSSSKVTYTVYQLVMRILVQIWAFYNDAF